MNLYEIRNEWLEAIESSFSPETGEMIEGTEDRFAEIENRREEKIENILRYIANLGGDEISIGVEIARLTEMRQKITKKKESLQNYLDSILSLDGRDRKYAFGNWNLKWNKGISTVIDDESKVAEIYKKTVETIKIDKAKIKEDLKSGKEVAGARLEESFSFSIK